MTLFRRRTSPASRGPCTKWNYLVKDIRELPRVINEAFAGRDQRAAGPACSSTCRKTSPAGIMPDRGRRHAARAHRLPPRKQAATHAGHASQAEAAAEAINRAEKPVLYVGGGAIISNGAWEAVAQTGRQGKHPRAPPPCSAWAPSTSSTTPKRSTCSACTAARTPTTPCRRCDVPDRGRCPLR